MTTTELAQMVADLLVLLVVFVALPLVWVAVFRALQLTRRRPGFRVLRERSGAARSWAILVTVFAVVFISNDRPIPPLDMVTTRLLTRGALFVLATYVSVRFLWLYRKGLQSPVDDQRSSK